MQRGLRSAALGFALLVVVSDAGAQSSRTGHRVFRPGSVRTPSDLPEGRFRSDLERLSPSSRDRALGWLRKFHFAVGDLDSLHVDTEGGVYYADTFALPGDMPGAQSAPVTAEAAVPVTPFPAGLIFHSRAGAPNVLFLNFSGESVTSTVWNTSEGRDPIPATAFSNDSDFSTFSDSEQLAIRRIWQRVAEDYAPFNVDVTTERPATLGTRVGMALITRNKDTNNLTNPSSSSGGVAYVGVFGDSDYGTYRPAWIYYNNLSNDESYIGEAVSHELGHNMGLSHDGTTDGDNYYGGHGSGDISWGPIMGTGYDRNVSQWSKGDYYHANMTQDDLAIIAGRLSYRVDDHGDTIAAASSLVINEGVITSTTPETDPENLQPENKGVIDRSTDVDVFAFVAGDGPVDLAVNPWIMPSGRTHGGNLDVSLELRDITGALIATNNPPNLTTAAIQADVVEGIYYLFVKNTGTGDPTNSSPTGFTVYGSLGQYFISGTVVPSSLIIPPQAQLEVTDINAEGEGAKSFTVTYSDNVAVDVSTISTGDVRVQGPGGYDQLARLVGVDDPSNGSPRTATYEVNPPSGGVWLPEHNGDYTITTVPGEVSDVEGAQVAEAMLGQFTVLVPQVIFSENFDADPGWTMDPGWGFGTPSYSGSGPTSGFTGTNIVAYNLSGNYEDSLPMRYVTTPEFNCSGVSSLSLRFHRWLGLRRGDSAVIEVSTNGADWTAIWSTTSTVSDSDWLEVQYGLPAWVEGSATVSVRWGLGSNVSRNQIGWNIDDMAILGGVPVDATPPTAVMGVSDITLESTLPLQFTVTYSDETGVQVSTLGSTDILVAGPDGYGIVAAEFLGVDIPADGTPRVATYLAPVPDDGHWDTLDNGPYQVLLMQDEVSDLNDNRVAETLLGEFSVAIPEIQLAATVNNSAWGVVSPTNGTFSAGQEVELTAIPAAYYTFDSWTGDLSGTNNPMTLVLTNSLSVQANFSEVFTTNYPTPLWWLAENGFTQDVETVVGSIGINGMPVWQSYVAGLDPNDPTSQFKAEAERLAGDAGWVLRWNTVTNRVYSVLQSTNLEDVFLPLPGATNLPSTIQSLTNPVVSGSDSVLFKIQVRKP